MSNLAWRISSNKSKITKPLIRSNSVPKGGSNHSLASRLEARSNSMTDSLDNFDYVAHIKQISEQQISESGPKSLQKSKSTNTTITNNNNNFLSSYISSLESTLIQQNNNKDKLYLVVINQRRSYNVQTVKQKLHHYGEKLIMEICSVMPVVCFTNYMVW